MKKVYVLIISIFCVFMLVGCNTKVNKKSWDKAFEKERFENCVLTVDTISGNKETSLMISKHVYEIRGNLIHVTYSYDIYNKNSTINGVTEEWYFSQDEDGYFKYYKVNDEWFRKNNRTQSITSFLDLETIKNEYSNFLYDKENKLYVNTQTIEEDTKTTKVGFKHHNINTISEVVDGGISITYTIEYKKVKINLPSAINGFDE